MQQQRLLLLFFLFFTVLSPPTGLQAQVDPEIEWKEIETKEAYWLFDAKHQEVAEYYIMQFQRAKSEVFPLFKEAPRKMTIILLDNTDLANGSARVTPHPIISLFTVQPSSLSSIGEFRNYVHELLVHEYTHILNMDPVHGWVTPFRWVFGSIAHPNMVLPRWYTEGLAVYTESLISQTGGRLNSQYLGGLARALTLEKRWDDFPLSDLNDSHPDWLGGSRAYLFGGILWESITREGGEDIIYDLNQSYSRRIPYLLDGPLKKHLGRSYEEQLARAYTHWDKKAQKQIDKLSEAPQMPAQLLTPQTDSLYSQPQISSDGLWMTHIKSDLNGSGHIELTLRHPKRGFRGYKPKTLLKNTRTQHLAWNPASTGFVYEKSKRWNLYNYYYDLYFYDLKSKKKTRLTRGQRAHSPCFSTDGKTLYFISNTTAAKKILAMDWDSKKTEEIHTTAIGTDVQSLTCGDANQLFFIEHIPGQRPKLSQLNLDSRERTHPLGEMPLLSLSKTHKGFLLSSSKSGVDNLYLWNPKTKSLKAMTNSLTRALHGALDPLDDSLYFSQITSHGPKLFHLKGAQWESLNDEPPQIDGLVDFAQKPKVAAQQPQTSSKNWTSKDFSPWRYLLPNHWIPFLYVVDGGTVYQAMTSAGDPLGIHSLSFVGQWDTLTRKAGGSASYFNNASSIGWGVSVSDVYNYFYPTDSSLHFSNASALLGTRIKALDNTFLRLRWNYSQLDFGSSIFIRQGPQLEMSYSDTKAKPNDISTSEGWRFQLGHREYMKDFGNQDYGETYAHLGSFWSSFTPGRSVFYLGLNGTYHPQLANSFFSPSTLAGPFFNPQITNTAFLQRGYPTGVFLSFNGLVNANAEYRFPMWDMFSGFTSPPVFFKNLKGHLIFDATTMDGAFNNSQLGGFQQAEMGRWFTGYGLELESNINVGFHVPITLTLGLYYGQEELAFGGFTTFFNLRL